MHFSNTFKSICQTEVLESYVSAMETAFLHVIRQYAHISCDLLALACTRQQLQHGGVLAFFERSSRLEAVTVAYTM